MPVILALIAGAVIAAVAGTALFGRLSDARLERMILVLLLAVGVALIVEGSLPGDTPVLLPSTSVFWVGADLLFGLGIGLVSSLLGVAGGEVIIPTLVFAYGADIKTAGTTSLLISLPTSPSALPATPGNMPTHREPSPRPSPRCSWAR